MIIQLPIRHNGAARRSNRNPIITVTNCDTSDVLLEVLPKAWPLQLGSHHGTHKSPLHAAGIATHNEESAKFAIFSLC